jgi:SAM-dependent methyltransferase
MSAATPYEDGTYLGNNPTWHQEDSRWKADQIRRILQANGVSPRRVGEVGCGAGEVLKCLAEDYGSDVVFEGYDISPNAYEIASKKQATNLKFVLGDLLAVPGEPFDVALAIDVFEHIDDYLGFLRRFRTRGTYKVFHIPLDLSVQSVLRSSPILKGRATVGHLHYFTKETALATLKDTGYEIVDSFYTHGGLDLPNRGWKANLMRLPRRLFVAAQPDLAVRVLGGASLLVLAR